MKALCCSQPTQTSLPTADARKQRARLLRAALRFERLTLDRLQRGHLRVETRAHLLKLHGRKSEE